MTCRPHNRCVLAGLVSLAFMGVRFSGAADSVPLIAAYEMEPDAQDGARLIDSGPQHLHGKLAGAVFAEGHSGQALKVDGANTKAVVELPKDASVRVSTGLTLAAWVYIERMGKSGHMSLFGTPDCQMRIAADGNLALHAFRGSWHYDGPWVQTGLAKRWMHMAITYRQGGSVSVYLDGELKRAAPADFYIWTDGKAPLQLGGADWSGKLDSVHLYAAELSAEQVKADMRGEALATRAPAAADAPPPLYSATLELARYDCPRGQDDMGRRARAERRAGPDAIDWPTLTVNGVPAFKDGPTLAFYSQPRRGSLWQEKDDPVIQPGNHWFRYIDWLWGRKHVYTADATARGGVQEYELWLFPVAVRGAGDADVRDVKLAVEGTTIYERAEPLRSLTLLLPQSEAGKPYELTVAGRGPVRFEAGLQPRVPGRPEEKVRPVDLKLPGNGPVITVRPLERPDPFPHQRQWAADLAALAKAELPSAAEPERGEGLFARHLGLDVPRSPLAVYAAALPHGMSGGGGFFFINQQQASRERPYADVDAYARYIAGLGYDRIVEMVERFPAASEAGSAERWAAALSRQGVQAMVEPDVAWKRPYLAHPNLALFSACLTDWHAPLYRDVQLMVQRLSGAPGFRGLCLGADNGGYVSYWDWAPPEPQRPWGEAIDVLEPGHPHKLPLPGQPGFFDHVARYDESFKQYGTFARAVSAVNSNYVTATGSFGSSPGVGGRGGWAWATIPGKPMHEGLPVMQAYDWNELSSSKPMHVAALVDRLKSYYPEKPAWALVDDFCFLFDRATRQRAYALALTRGVQAIGTTFVPAPRGERSWPAIVAEQQELYAWLHRFGGVYAQTRPLAPVGILYVHEQALLRGVNQNEKASESDLILNGCHEGKTTEALFLCHAAGWPARIVTPEELKRGLPPEMQVLLLTGLPKIDPEWLWHRGLEAELGRFVKRGGRVLLDHDSVCPVEAVKTDLRVCSFVPQRGRDWTPELLARNAGNVTKLRAALAGVSTPFMTSEDPALWAVPTAAGDVWYGTAVNQLMAEESGGARRPENDSSVAGRKVSDLKPGEKHLTLKPRRGVVAWHTDRPVYDLRARRALAAGQAAQVDLTRDAFQFYALPPAAPTAPAVKVTRQSDGFYAADVAVGAKPMRGVPVELSISRGAERATLFGVSGTPVVLPVREGEAEGACRVEAVELLSGLKGEVTFAVSGAKAAPAADGRLPRRDVLGAFAARKGVPLVVALTDAQAAQAEAEALAERVASHYRAKGRQVSVGRAEPGGVVLGLQATKGPCAYPHWCSGASDLILFGTPRDNVLLLDQARGGLLAMPENAWRLAYTWSPFRGECDAVNVLAATPEQMRQAVDALLAAP